MNTERINQLKTDILEKLWTKYQEQRPIDKRNQSMINELINDLAIERAKNEILEKK